MAVGIVGAGAGDLDRGARPGWWVKTARGVGGPRGAVVGIDRQPLPQPVPGTRVLVGDLYTTSDEELRGELAAFDAVLSDMAPDTTGIRSTDQARSAALFEEALGRAERMLAPAGSFVGKIFQGPDITPLRRRMNERFALVKLWKPEGSRAASSELYLVGKGFAPG
jgi:23S rRNA (uridine2552-2'-O)-methyltransferase